MPKRSDIREWLTPAEFQARAAKHPTAVSGLGILKDFAPEMEPVEGQALTIRFRITSGSVDRDRDTINPRGWNVEHFKSKNPVVLWAHCYDQPPVAKALTIDSDGTSLVSLAEFTPQDLYPFGYMIYRMCRDGFLNMCSVGFGAEEWVYNESRQGVDFAKQSLYEFSVCPVGSNPDALVLARSAGIDLAPLKSWAEQTLDGIASEPGLWLPKSKIEAAFKILNGEKAVSVPAPSADRAPDPVTEDLAKSHPPNSEPVGEPDRVPAAAEPVKTIEDPEQKRGRVLSGSNERALRNALDCHEKGCQHLKDVLAKLDELPEEDTVDTIFIKEAEPEFVLTLSTPLQPAKEAEQTITLPEFQPTLSPTVSVEEIRATVRDALVEGISSTVESAIRRARGRID